MKQTRQRTGVIAGVLLPLGLICVFAFCSLALALMGGEAYKGTNDTIDDSYNTTVVASYLRTKLAQNNRADAVQVRNMDGVEYLIITTENGYETHIFVYNGILYESMVMAGQPLDSNSYSVEIARVQSCTFAISDDGLFEAEIVSGGGSTTRLAFALAQGVSA